MEAVENETKEYFAEIYPDNGRDISEVIPDIIKEQVRSLYWMMASDLITESQ